MAQQYIASLVDPFDQSIKQPKILDGAVDESAGLRFRQSGVLNLSDAGVPAFFALVPGFAQNLTYRLTSADYIAPPPYQNHFGTAELRQTIRRIRLVSCAARFQLMNSSDDNEGYWEAIRLPLSTLELDNVGAANAVWQLPSGVGDGMNFADYPSYQTGPLRDLYRYQFKLNSTAAEHPFTSITPNPLGFNNWQELSSFDFILLRINGRVQTGAPSVVRYDTISNQELVYDQATVQARLQTPNFMLPNMNVIHDKTRYKLPAVQIT